VANNNFAFEGVYAAALTPLTEDLDPDLGLMAAHCRWLLDNGCDGLAILGTTGEANSFGLKERIGILDGLAERRRLPPELLDRARLRSVRESFGRDSKGGCRLLGGFLEELRGALEASPEELQTLRRYRI